MVTDDKETNDDIGVDSENPTSLIESNKIEDEMEDIPSLTSYDIFEKCLRRAENLVSVHDSTKHIDEISDQHYSDCYRAAVVLSISALDAYVRKIVISEISKNLINSKKALNPKLADYIKGLLNQDKLLEAARKYDLLEKVEESVKADFENKSFQGEWKISNWLEMVGYKDIFSDVSIKADINEKNLRRKLTIFTTRRHIIAHSGDYDLNQNPPDEKSIDKTYAIDCIKTVKLFAKTINEIIEENE